MSKYYKLVNHINVITSVTTNELKRPFLQFIQTLKLIKIVINCSIAKAKMPYNKIELSICAEEKDEMI